MSKLTNWRAEEMPDYQGWRVLATGRDGAGEEMRVVIAEGLSRLTAERIAGLPELRARNIRHWQAWMVVMLKLGHADPTDPSTENDWAVGPLGTYVAGRIENLEAEIEALKTDIENAMDAATQYANENTRLEAENAALRAQLAGKEIG